MIHKPELHDSFATKLKICIFPICIVIYTVESKECVELN